MGRGDDTTAGLPEPAPSAAPDGGALRADGLEVRYPGSDPAALPALRLTSLELVPGRSLALVGESGSGKTTALRALLGLVRPTAGGVTFAGVPLPRLRGDALRDFRRQVQPIPQDIDGALDPRQRIGSAIGEGWRAGGRVIGGPGERQESVVKSLLDEVGLPASVAHRHPHEVSGGQRQRAIIARALAVGPRILLLDEPTSGLDATVQVRILELIERLRAEHGLGILLISHNLGVVARLCSETLVLYRGEVVEEGSTADLLAAPRMPYTATLRRSVPEIGVPFRAPWEPSTDAPSIDPLVGCRFGPRCPHARSGPCSERQLLIPVGDPPRPVRCIRSPELGVLDPLG
jgi:oligopeptide/dipeptide ABC transporter ATP-binding protein